MKEYELSVLFHPDLEMNLAPALDKVKKLVETSGGKITKEEPEGKKRLAYQIKGNDYALYYYFNIELPAEAPSKISTGLGISDEVIRYLIVKADPRRAKYAAAKAAEATESTDSADSDDKSADNAEEKEA
ncbi:MAG: 30S ribosomal protein S6 [Candidatus Saccharibacteria bacterium]|nr:30S ribosomal protein S6 [Candidatus Saccharibacteria bacterium]